MQRIFQINRVAICNQLIFDHRKQIKLFQVALNTHVK